MRPPSSSVAKSLIGRRSLYRFQAGSTLSAGGAGALNRTQRSLAIGFWRCAACSRLGVDSAEPHLFATPEPRIYA